MEGREKRRTIDCREVPRLGLGVIKYACGMGACKGKEMELRRWIANEENEDGGLLRGLNMPSRMPVEKSDNKWKLVLLVDDDDAVSVKLNAIY